MSSQWDAVLPTAGPGKDLSGERLDNYFQACAELVCEARNQDNFDLAAGFMAPDVLVALERADQSAAATAATGRVTLAHEQVILDEMVAEPIGCAFRRS